MMKKYWNKPLGVSVLCGVLCTIGVTAFAQNYTQANVETAQISLDLGKVFQGSPIIYTILFCLSMIGFVLWVYSLLTLKASDMAPDEFLESVEEHINHKRYEAAQSMCNDDASFAASVLRSGLSVRRYGNKAVIEAIESEGKRKGVALWQRISLLNDIALIAPMLGLLGTVVGMFYAFYDVNRTTESLAYIFDGLGIAIGTTVSGLIVAILAIVFYTTLKFRLVRMLAAVENKVVAIGNRIDQSE